jgi:rod shape-determining protein MreD
MSERARASGTGIILLTLLLAAIVDVMPWPDALAWFHPQWLVLVLLYWVLALPERVGVFWGFGVGLFQDVLFNTPFGQHALALTIASYLTLLAYKRLRRLDPGMQSLMIFLLVGTDLWISYIVQDAVGHVWLPPYVMLCLAVASGVVWLPVYSLLRFLRRQFLVR